jgi:uncharacterized protein (DUF2062 family)
MPRRLFKEITARLAPFVEQVTQHRFVRRYVPGLADPDLWHLNRRSTARAVAVGLFSGLVPGPLQVLCAVGLTILFRANFPLAVATTLYTNPVTIVPLYLLAWHYGALFVPGETTHAGISPPTFSWSPGFFAELLRWMAELGKPLAIGLPLLALTLAAAGFVLVHLAWRIHAAYTWRKRQRARSDP